MSICLSAGLSSLLAFLPTTSTETSAICLVPVDWPLSRIELASCKATPELAACYAPDLTCQATGWPKYDMVLAMAAVKP